MGKRELLLIVVFVAVGVIVYSFTAPPPGPNERSLSLSHFINEIRREVRGDPGKAEITTTTAYPLDTETTEIVVRDNFSQVQIVGEQRTDIEATVRVTSNGYDDEEAKRLAGETKLKTDRPGGAISFSPDAPERGVQRLYLTMKVPSRLHVRVETPSSRIGITNVPSLDITSGRTETTVKQVTGRANVVQRGGKLVIEDVEALKLNARGAETTLRNIRGDASITVISGDMRAEGLSGPIDLEVQNAEVRVDRPEKSKGPLRVNAVGGQVTLNGLRSEARIDARNAEIAVVMGAPAPVVIYTTGDEAIDVTLPTGGYVLDAVATEGRISEDVVRELGLAVTTGSDAAKEQRVSGSVKGGGPTITIRTTGGNIRLAKK
jgi:hypothetical protein